MFNPYGVIISSPRSPARAAIRSNHLLLVSMPTSRRYTSGSGVPSPLGYKRSWGLNRRRQHRRLCRQLEHLIRKLGKKA